MRDCLARKIGRFLSHPVLDVPFIWKDRPVSPVKRSVLKLVSLELTNAMQTEGVGRHVEYGVHTIDIQENFVVKRTGCSAYCELIHQRT